ncbi:uncharacterized protein [Nicotiana sylvestris]|uniref:uncharacterized protein n=1 Tax=Nicotiana sylvestris TaxID=4096 RepID=UPI00388CE4C1
MDARFDQVVEISRQLEHVRRLEQEEWEAKRPHGSDMHVHMSTLVDDYIMVDCVCRSCVVTIGGYETRVDLLLLSMVDFEVILGMDWLSPYRAILDCHAKTVMLVILGLPRLEWRGSLSHTPSRVISYLKVQRIVEKGCLAYLDIVRDVSADTPTVELVLAVRDFLDMFHADLMGMPQDRDIDLVLFAQRISIPPYHMTPT